MGDAEPFSGADYRRQHLLGHDGYIYRLVFGQADVAVAAGFVGRGVAEVVQQVLAAASGQAGVVDHPLQLAFRRGAGVAGHSLDEKFLFGAVAGGEEEDAVAGPAVAAGAPGFLVIALNGFGQGVVDHQADVGLVNAHSESNGGGDHGNRAVNKAFLGAAAGIGVQAGVVGDGGVAPGGQIFRQFLGILAGEAIDDGGLAGSFVQQFRQGGGGSGLGADDVGQVGAVKAGDELRGIPQPELVNDVLAHPRRGRGGQGH